MADLFRARLVYPPLIAVLVAVLLLPFSNYASAATAITIDSTGCATIGGSWSDPVCTLDQNYTLDFGYQIFVPAGNELVVNRILTDNGEIFTDSAPHYWLTGGNITIGLNGAIIVNNAMTDNYRITNHGEIGVDDNANLINNGGGTFINTGYLALSSLGTITTHNVLNNSGTIASLGSIYNTNTGTIHNTGTFNTGGFLTTLDTFDNHGTFENSGAIKILGGFTSYGTFSNSGNITVGQDAFLSNEKGGTFDNNAGGVIFGGVRNDGSLNNSGIIGAAASATNPAGVNNDGVTANKGTVIGGIINGGTFNNEVGSIFINGTYLDLQNEFINDGTFNNKGGKITVSYYMENNLFATFKNHGSLTNLPGSRIDNIGVMNNSFVTYFPIINNSGTFNNYAKGKFVNDLNGTVLNGATGTFDNKVNSNFINSGNFYDIGSLSLSGNATNKAAGSLYTAHACPDCVSMLNGGNFVNHGLFANAGLADVSGTFDAGIVSNHGIITNDGQISNFGTLNNTGTITSSGQMYGVGLWNNKAGGKIDNSGLFRVNNLGFISNDALLTNELKGNITIDKGGTISNNAGATINNNGFVGNHGLIYNHDYATINNYGTITNYTPALLVNSAHGTLNNHGKIINDDVASITNSGLTDNFGTIINEPADSIFNNGTLKIESGAFVYNYGALVNGAGGTITNFGSIYNEPGGSISGTPISGGSTVAIPAPAVTDGSFCSLVNNQTRLSYVQDSSTSYNLVSSNPGQYYYNVFFISGLDSAVGTQFTLKLPYPFVTQGTVPVQVFENQHFPTCGSKLPKSNVNNMLTISPSKVTLSSYGNSPTIGVTTSAVNVTLNSPVPAGSLLWFTIHLDYGLKGYDFTKDINNNAFGTTSTPSFNPAKEIANGQLYNFSYSAPILSMSTPIQSANKFYKDPGIVGIISSASTGNPLSGVQVQIYSSSNTLLATLTTDQNGYYSYSYSGTTATFTVKLPAYSVSQTVKVKSGSYATVNFTV